jgi:dihydrodipicolinate synthase/N-acetylneuraminate lyase
VVELAVHPRILGLLDAAASPAEIESILHHTASIQREVTVTQHFAAITARMKIAASRATASLVSADSLASDRAASANAVAEAPPTTPLRTRTKSVGFQILTGDTQAILESLRAGATGAAPALAAAAPQACYEVFAAWKDDDQPLAEEKQSRLCAAALLTEESPGGLKFACDLNGYFGGLPRLPLQPPTGAQRAAIEQIMKPIRN